MTGQLKQFVPSSACLKCDGCCRFRLSDSPWRPKAGEQELQEGTDSQGYVKTIPQAGHHQCIFFNKTDNTCEIYVQRPFECALYPFVLSQTAKGLEVYAHLACPYIQDQEQSPQLQEYVTYLKEFFGLPRIRSFLEINGSLLHDYTSFQQELKFLFTIEV